MRKSIFVLSLIAVLCVSTLSFAAVGYKKDGTNTGQITTIDIKNGLSTFDGNTVSLYSSGYKDGVTTNVSGESNLTSAALAYGIILLADTGALDGSDARYISLANGTPGQMITIQLVTATAGTIYITDDYVSDVAAAALLATGWDDLAFGTALDQVTLLYVDDTYGWIIIGQYGVAVT